MIARRYGRERDVGALGKHRMVFEQRADLCQIIGLRIVDPENRVRIAHADDRRRVQDRCAARADLKLDRPRIGKFLGQRDFIPPQAGAAHVNGEPPVAGLPARNEPGGSFES